MDYFDPPLGPDPSMALSAPSVPPLVEGPAHRVQYVIELVGPRSVPASVISVLVGDQWFNALGQPELFCMAPMDQSWTRLTARKDGSYDSVALCWDIVSARGVLSSATSQHLLNQAEHFAKSVNRRAMPLPVPADIDRMGKDLLKIQEQLDVGASIAVLAKRGHVMESDLWRICARLGLQFSPGGSFDLRTPNFPYPLFSVTPIGDTESFSLGAVKNGARHDGVTVGFSAPRNPAPSESLDSAILAAKRIARAIDGICTDDEGRDLNPKVEQELRNAMGMAVQAFQQIGIKPGSSAALKLF